MTHRPPAGKDGCSLNYISLSLSVLCILPLLLDWVVRLLLPGCLTILLASALTTIATLSLSLCRRLSGMIGGIAVASLDIALAFPQVEAIVVDSDIVVPSLARASDQQASFPTGHTQSMPKHTS